MSSKRVAFSAVLLVSTWACAEPEKPVMPLSSDALLAKPSGPSDPTASFLFPTSDGALDVRSDSEFVSGSNSVYADGICGAKAKIFATEGASNSGDATLQTNNPSTKDRKCPAYPRTLTVVFGPGDQQTSAVFINLREIANTTYQMPIGTTVRRGLHLNEARCDGLIWQTEMRDGTNTLGADSVSVTRTSATTWEVASQPYPDNEAFCRNLNQAFHLNVRFTVVASSPQL